ncbi:MAG: DUF6036 family nucleotidyltransferase [Acidobacteriota bacterium]
MAISLPQDFKEFLNLLNSHKVEYLLIGGYAVGFHGYPRATNDMDIWIATSQENANRLVTVLREFGFNTPDLSPDLFLKEKSIIRMGVPPVKIEVSNYIDGVTFDDCFRERVVDAIDGVVVNLINLAHLKINKLASGRFKDLADLENLP